MFSEQTLQRGAESSSSSHVKLVQHLSAVPDALYMLENRGPPSSSLAWSSADIGGASVPSTLYYSVNLAEKFSVLRSTAQ
jgi:hypothetical protein